MLIMVYHSIDPLSSRYLVETTTAIKYPLDFLGNQKIKFGLYKQFFFYCCLFFVLFSRRTQETLYDMRTRAVPSSVYESQVFFSSTFGLFQKEFVVNYEVKQFNIKNCEINIKVNY